MGAITNNGLNKLWMRLRAYINARLESIDESVQGMIDSSNHIEMDLLWENASPTSEFGAQTLSFEGDYDALIITACYSSSYIRTANTTLVNLNSDNVNCVLNVTWQTNVVRMVNITKSDTTLNLDFVSGYYYSSYSGSQTTGATYCIPLAIYGIKGVEINE